MLQHPSVHRFRSISKLKESVTSGPPYMKNAHNKWYPNYRINKKHFIDSNIVQQMLIIYRLIWRWKKIKHNHVSSCSAKSVRTEKM